MPELDAEHREQLAETLENVVADLNNRGAISDGYGWTEIADGLAPLVAGWIADAAYVNHEGGYVEGFEAARTLYGGDDA